MNSKERMLLAINNEKPDRLPVSIHQWQKYHLDRFMGGISDVEAFKRCGLDAQIQYSEETNPFWLMNEHVSRFDTSLWKDEAKIIKDDPDARIVHHTISTPEATLTYKTAGDSKTVWVTEYLIKHEEDIHLVKKYMPISHLNRKAVARKYDEIGDDGILRGFVWGDQGGCWQHAACLYKISDLIMATFDRPDWVHEFLQILLEKKLQYIDSMNGAKFDLVETGGGSASSTLISPALHKEFCLPYDLQLHDALHDAGFKVTYHTCGGTRGIEEYIVANHADVSETLAPVSVGGNQEPWEFKARVGNRIACIGGVDQFNMLTSGTKKAIRDNVFELFTRVGYEGGYICSASDHFFETPVKNLIEFAEAAKECVY